MTTNQTVQAHEAANDAPEVVFVTNCPYCQADQQTNLDFKEIASKPHVGAINICNECAGVSLYHADGTLRVFSDAEIATLDPEDQRHINHFVTMIKTVNAGTSVNQVMPNHVETPGPNHYADVSTHAE
jgi:hypothetical protein